MIFPEKIEKSSFANHTMRGAWRRSRAKEEGGAEDGIFT
jgi:hypothetical protein